MPGDRVSVWRYDLTGAGKTILRIGAGAMYERIQGNDMYNAGGKRALQRRRQQQQRFDQQPSTDLATGQTVSSPIPVAGLTGISLNDFANPGDVVV